MKDKDFNDLLKSIDQARAIHRGELRPKRTHKISNMVEEELHAINEVKDASASLRKFKKIQKS